MTSWDYVEQQTAAGVSAKVIDHETGAVIALVKHSGKECGAGPVLAAAPALPVALATVETLTAILGRYMAAYPAFRMKPIGAPGSVMRVEQENLMALEDAARAAIAKATGATP